MKDYVQIVKHEGLNSLSVCFYIEQEKILALGEKMNELHEGAYMNGYNWEALFNYYLASNHSDVLEGMSSDPEAGMYLAYYTLTPDNEKKANKLVNIIKYLVENESELYKLAENHGN